MCVCVGNARQTGKTKMYLADSFRPFVSVCVCSLHARLLRLCFDCTQALNLYTIWHFYPLYADPDRRHRRTDVVSIEPVLVLLCSAFQNIPAYPSPHSFLVACSVCVPFVPTVYLWLIFGSAYQNKKSCQAKTHTHTHTQRRRQWHPSPAT